MFCAVIYRPIFNFSTQNALIFTLIQQFVFTRQNPGYTALFTELFDVKSTTVHDTRQHVMGLPACGPDTRKLMCIVHTAGRQPVQQQDGVRLFPQRRVTYTEGGIFNKAVPREPVYIFSTQSLVKGRLPFPQTCNIDLLSKREKVKGTVT